MKNIFYLIFILSFDHSVISQEINSEGNVIFCTSNKNTNLFFTNPIKKGIVGNQNFTFGYSKDVGSKIGILKAVPGEESNLLVITENGNIFSFIIRYSKDIQKLNYFINDSLSVGNELGEMAVSVNSKREVKEEKKEKPALAEMVTINNFEENDLLANDSTAVYKKICLKEMVKSTFYNRIYGANSKVTIKLKNISYINEDLYFTLILKNDSSLDYDINYLNFYIKSRNKKKNTTTQTIPYKYKYVHNLPTRIRANENIEVVFVYSKFSINENKIILIEMAEDRGERTISLEIPNTFINNPN